MKKSLLLITIIILSAVSHIKAQLLPPLQPEQDACNALLLCGNSFTTPFSYVGQGSLPDLTNTPCFGGENNCMWIRLNINTAGTLVFTISPLNLTDDYDFAVLNITNTTCSNLSSANVIRCNFNNNWPGSNVNGVVGLNTTSTAQFTTAGAFGGSFLQQINANAGDVYLIMINNFGDPFVGGPSSGFTIDFTGSTATFFDNGNPTMSSVIPSCDNSQQITLQMSENIKCSSIAANGSDFSLSSGTIASATGINCTNLTGYTDKIVLSFASPLPAGNYTLNAQTGTDGNTLLDLCNNPLLLPAAIQFTIPPYVQPAYLAVDTPACSEIKIALVSKVNCDSIAPNGSDFAISGPQAATVIGAYGIGCDTANFTDTVVLFLQSPLQTDGVYTITAQKGTDGNTLIDSCGLLQSVGNAISYTINTFDGRIVSSNDTILCKSDFILLHADNTSTPPLANVSCGAASAPCAGNTQVVFAGGGSETSTDVNSPFYGQWEDSKSQYLFLASELKAMGLKAGSIRKLEWKVTQKNSTLPYNSFNIKIACTPLNDLSSGYIPMSSVIYSTAAYTSVAGWNTFELTNPYNWDGTSNLVFEVCYDNSSSSSNDLVAHSSTAFNAVIHRYGNGLSGCGLTIQGNNSSFTTQRPKMRFYICEPPAGTANYTWSPGNFFADSTLQESLVYVNSSITYQVKTIDRFGCMHRDTTNIIRSDRSVALSPRPDTTICIGESVLLQAAGGQGYVWQTTDNSITCTNCATPVVTPLQNSFYTVVINDQYNCFDTLNTTVFVKPLPILTTYPGDTMVKYGTQLQLGVSGAYLYQWTPSGHVSDPNLNTPVALITEPTVFVVTGIDTNGCRQSDTIRVNVDYSNTVFIPSAFSPNNDGRNDIFKIGSINFEKLQEFRIFNRWGEQVFTTSDPKIGWDGTYKGVDQEAGVYQYLIKLSYPDGKVKIFKGDVTLVR